MWSSSSVPFSRHVWLFGTPWTAAYQAPPSMGFSRWEYWSGLPLPSPGDKEQFLLKQLNRILAEKREWLDISWDTVQLSSVQSLSCVRLFGTPWTAVHQASLSINSQSPPKPMSIESVMPSNHLILCRPLLLLPSIFPSIRVFSNESALCIRWPKYWSFSFNISPTVNEHPGLISFRTDWLNLFAFQGTLKSLLQYHSLKASVLWRLLAFFMVQLSHHMTTEKTIALIM